jgi:hypothetical protein
MIQQPFLPEPLPADGNSSSNDVYTVGYGRPPLHTRFKPGQSGNRRGRPKHQRNLRTVLEETLDEPITIPENNATRSVRKRDALVLSIVNGSLKGDSKSLVALLSLLKSLGMLGEAPEATKPEQLTDNDDALLVDYLQRFGAASEPPHDPDANVPSKQCDSGGSIAPTTASDKGAKS